MRWHWLVIALLLSAPPLASAQGCLAGCAQPQVRLDAPASIEFGWTDVQRPGVIGIGVDIGVRTVVNVTYERTSPLTSTDSSLTLEVAGSPGLGILADPQPIAPGSSVTIPVVFTADLNATVGRHVVRLFANLSATNVYDRASVVREMEVLVPHVAGGNALVREGPLVLNWWRLEVQVQGWVWSNAPTDVIVEFYDAPPGTSGGEEGEFVGRVVVPTSSEFRTDGASVAEASATLRGVYRGLAHYTYVGRLDAGGLSCLASDGLRPLGDRTAVEVCGSSGGGAGSLGMFEGAFGDSLWVAVLFAALTAAMVSAFVLAVLVWRKGGDALAPRFISVYLLAHSVSFGLFSLHVVLFTLRLPTTALDAIFSPPVGIALLVCVSLLGPLFLAFGLSYPRPVPWIERRKWLLALPLVVPLGVLALGIAEARSAGRVLSSVGVPFHMWDGITMALLYTGFLLLIGAALLSAWLFRRRSKEATGEVERERLKFMVRFVALPLAVLPFLVQVILDWTIDTTPLLFFAFALPAFVLLALVPVIALGFGVLRYRMLELDRRFRHALSRALIGAVFVVVFFAVAEAAEAVLTSETQSRLVGLLGSGMLVLGLRPMERAADRFVERLLPRRREPRLEAYRAAFEDFTNDDRLDRAERRALDALARTFEVTAKERAAVEEEVRRERRESN